MTMLLKLRNKFLKLKAELYKIYLEFYNTKPREKRQLWPKNNL
jgi:hypothetical protein